MHLVKHHFQCLLSLNKSQSHANCQMVVHQNHNIQSISCNSQKTDGKLEGQESLPKLISDYRRPMDSRQHLRELDSQQPRQQAGSQQQQKQKQVHSELSEKKPQLENFCHSSLPSHIRQEKEQTNLLQTTQQQSLAQSVMKKSSVIQPSVMQSSPFSEITPDKSFIEQSTQSMFGQHQQSVSRQPQKASITYQQQMAMLQHPILPSQQQQQQLMLKQPNPRKKVAKKQKLAPNMKQEQQMMLCQQNTISNLRQQRQLPLDQKINLSYAHQQQLGRTSNLAALGQRQRVVGSGPGNHAQQSNQCQEQQKTQQTASAKLQFREQQSQPHQPLQKLMSQSQLQLAKLHHLTDSSQQDIHPRDKTSGSLLQQQQTQRSTSAKLPLLEQQSQPYQPLQKLVSQSQLQLAKLQHLTDSSQQDIHPRDKTSGTLLQQQQTQRNTSAKLPFLEQQSQPHQPLQKLVSQSQLQLEKLQHLTDSSQQDIHPRDKTSVESSSEMGHQIVPEWQQNAYQKIQRMRDTYLPALTKIDWIIVSTQQNVALPGQVKTDTYCKLENLKLYLKHHITFLNVSERNISPALKERLDEHEKRIVNIVNSKMFRTIVAKEGQDFPMRSMHALHQSFLSQSQSPQALPLIGQVNPHLLKNLQASMRTMKQNSTTSIQHDSLGELTTAATAPDACFIIDSPGMSLSPLLEAYDLGEDLTDATTLTRGKSNNTEQPLERLINLVKSMSQKALSASVDDIGSIVSLFDRVAGSTPGSGSITAVGEDLGAMANSHFQAWNMMQGATTGTGRKRRHFSPTPMEMLALDVSLIDLEGTDSEVSGLYSLHHISCQESLY